MSKTALERELESWGKEVVKNAKKFLKEGKGSTSLEKTIKSKVKYDGNKVTVQFYMADYGTFVDKGVRGAGGEIKSGKNEGNWRGKRFYKTYKGKKRQSPYIFGSGKSRGGSIYTGIEKFIKKKGIKGRSSITGRFITNKSLAFAITKVLWVKGIHGISFFQKALGIGLSELSDDLRNAIKQDIQKEINTINEQTKK